MNDLAEVLSADANVFQVIAESQHAMTFGQIRAVVLHNEHTIASALGRLTAAGRVVRARGGWAVAS